MNFDELISGYSDLLYNFARARLSEPEDIEDVIQETFLAVLETWDKFKGQSSPTTWMIGILKNKILDTYRKKYKNSKVILESDLKNFPFDSSGSWINRQTDSRKSTEEKFENNYIWESLMDCVEKMPMQHRILYKMRELDKIQTKTICNELSITATNLHVLMHRIRIQLKICLEIKGINNV